VNRSGSRGYSEVLIVSACMQAEMIVLLALSRFDPALVANRCRDRCATME
jgi:hypothetical protein